MGSREEKKSMLLEAAVEIYASQGDVTARELAASTGMNVASLNYYFGSKEALMNQIEQRLLSLFVEEITLADDRRSSPLERLYQLLLGVSQNMADNPGIARHFVEMLVSGEPRIYQLLEQAVGVNSRIYKVFSGILAEVDIRDDDEIWHRMIIAISALAPTLIASMGRSSQTTETESLLQIDFIRGHIRILAGMLLAR
jgi:AcrR family transcriptional regulator